MSQQSCYKLKRQQRHITCTADERYLVYFAFTRHNGRLFQRHLNALQVSRPRAVAVEQLIASGVGVYGVGLRVEELEGLCREGNLNGSGLSGLDGYSLEATEGKQRAFAVGKVTDVELQDLAAITAAGGSAKTL